MAHLKFSSSKLQFLPGTEGEYIYESVDLQKEIWEHPMNTSS